MKILYVGSFSEQWMSEEYIAKSFEALGHYVKRFDERETPMDTIIDEAKNDYDFLLYARLRVDDQKYLLDNINLPKVCWFFDLYPNTPRERRLRQPWVQMADYFFTTDDGNNEFYKKMGIKHQCIRQGIYHEEAIDVEIDKRNLSKLLFVGAQNHWHGQRQKLLTFLQETYKKDFRWPRQTIRQLALNKAIASSEIVIGHSIYSPHYWSNRIYETLGRGGFIITPRVEGLEEEFTEGKHIVCYNNNDFEDLKNKIEYYLTHKEEREAIRVAGVKYCRENYTYKHRVNELINHIYENNNSIRQG